MDSFDKAVQQMIEKQTPNAGGICKDGNCNGHVVQQVAALFHGQFFYSTPVCNVCERAYIFAQNVPKVGEESFLEILSQPMTI